MKKILMIILDGFGIREEPHGNAIKTANMPFFNQLWDQYPHSLLEASGEAVGLPANQFGNSEVGHGAIGLGRAIKQKITIVNEEISKKTIYNNEALKEMVNHITENQSNLHLMGLLSDGGVHSDIEYMLKLLPILKELGVKKLFFHAITDGRDTSIDNAMSYINKLKDAFKQSEIGEMVSVCGRYYAMDRDNNYDRTKHYYNLVALGNGLKINNLELAIQNCYIKNIYDEFLPPLLINHDVKFEEHDALLWLNFRQDRSTQIIESINNPEFKGFSNKIINNFKVYTLFGQDDIKNVVPLFEFNQQTLYPIGEYFSDLGISQARVAETEKYAHVTRFFNAEKSIKFKGTDNFLVPSPSVRTYDLQPIMSAVDVTKQTIKCLEKDYEFILVNYANPDMVGHTGNFDATVSALEGLDLCLKDVVTSADDNFYKVIILADHGNADTMISDSNQVITTHSMALVPFILLDKNVKLRSKGDLTMVAPTLLEYVDISIPKDMKESKSLIIDDN